MPQRHSSIQTDIHFTSFEIFLEELSCTVGDGQQALNNQADHAREQHHDCRNGNHQTGATFKAFTSRQAKNQTEHYADNHRIADHAVAFLDLLSIDIASLHERDFFIDSIK